MATGNQIHVGWVSCQVASLQLLSRLKVHGVIRDRRQVDELPLPCRMQNMIGMLFTQTIRVTDNYDSPRHPRAASVLGLQSRV